MFFVEVFFNDVFVLLPKYIIQTYLGIQCGLFNKDQNHFIIVSSIIIWRLVAFFLSLKSLFKEPFSVVMASNFFKEINSDGFVHA